ncbi:MAG TPA: PspC domain-containing protein [Anaerolineaceae bacterium]|nr:PspC domain-containing protein [Anaerolineaceae bacterium]
MVEENRRLYRSRTDRRISGICGGLAAYFKIDPTLVRLLFVLGLLLVGGTFWAYIIMMIVIPEEPL